jgi:hypothetical protein
MARILADDFILVTSSGKTQMKEDLLNEARERKTTYERQEDSNQTVRLWGRHRCGYREAMGERDRRRQAIRRDVVV